MDAIGGQNGLHTAVILRRDGARRLLTDKALRDMERRRDRAAEQRQVEIAFCLRRAGLILEEIGRVAGLMR